MSEDAQMGQQDDHFVDVRDYIEVKDSDTSVEIIDDPDTSVEAIGDPNSSRNIDSEEDCALPRTMEELRDQLERMCDHWELYTLRDVSRMKSIWLQLSSQDSDVSDDEYTVYQLLGYAVDKMMEENSDSDACEDDEKDSPESPDELEEDAKDSTTPSGAEEDQEPNNLVEKDVSEEVDPLGGNTEDPASPDESEEDDTIEMEIDEEEMKAIEEE